MKSKNRHLTLFVALTLAISALTLAAGCGRAKNDPLGAPTDLPKGDTASVKVYYPVEGSMAAETHVIEKTNNMPKAALDELFKLKPDNNSLRPVLPATKVLSVVVKNDGEAVVDFDRRVLDFKASKEEQSLAAAAIASTLGEFQGIKKVRFTVEGKNSGAIDGKDIERFWGDVNIGTTWQASKAE